MSWHKAGQNAGPAKIIFTNIILAGLKICDCILSNFSLHTEFYICVLPSDWMGNVPMNSEEAAVIKKHFVSVGCEHSMTGQHRGKVIFVSLE